ncbi:hypothetical protein DTL37_29190 [Escherichia coli]|nr:hypothetical protein DTL37_29190 [Escherichia coli]
MPTGIAYAIWSGVGIVLISLLSWGFFGQRLDLPAIIGMMLICAGVLGHYRHDVDLCRCVGY